MNKFEPNQPDPYITIQKDQELAKFGHLNWLIRKIPLISEDIDFKDSGISPNGKRTIIYYTNVTGSDFNISLPLDIPKKTISLLIINSLLSTNNVIVSFNSTSITLGADENLLCTYVDGRWFVIAKGGGSGPGGVQSVTGNIVNNTDPDNPVVTGVASGDFVIWIPTSAYTGNTTPAIPQLVGTQIRTSLVSGDFEVSLVNGQLIDPETYTYTLNTGTGALTFPNGPEYIRILKYAK